MQRTAIPSLVYEVDHRDEAFSLSEYFNQHGHFAIVEAEERRVVLPVDKPESVEAVGRLYLGWCDFWEHSDRGLWGLPIYNKTGCSHHS